MLKAGAKIFEDAGMAVPRCFDYTTIPEESRETYYVPDSLDLACIPLRTKTIVFPAFSGEKLSLRRVISHLPSTLEAIHFGHEGVTVDDERDDGVMTSMDDLQALIVQCPSLKTVHYCGYHSNVSEEDWKSWGSSHGVVTVGDR
jgi:hypothetical protein